MHHMGCKGGTILTWAARNNKEECIRLLIDLKADLNFPDKVGDTALRVASLNNHPNCARLLIENGARVNLPNIEGRTALTAAAAKDHQNCVRLLIEAGADRHRQDNGGGDALWCAASNQHRECVRLLMDTKKTNTALQLFSQDNQLPACELVTEVMLEIPTRKQSKWLINALCCLRRTFGKDITSSLFKAPLLAIVAEENSKDPKSYAKQEIDKIDSVVKYHLLKKYIKEPSGSCVLQ